MGDGAGRAEESDEQGKPASRATAVRHLVLGFGLLMAILLAAALCNLPR